MTVSTRLASCLVAVAIVSLLALAAGCKAGKGGGGGGGGNGGDDGHPMVTRDDAISMVRVQKTPSPGSRDSSGRPYPITRHAMVSESMVRQHPGLVRDRARWGTDEPFLLKVVSDEAMAHLTAEIRNQGLLDWGDQAHRSNARPHERNSWIAVTWPDRDRGVRVSQLNQEQLQTYVRFRLAFIQVYNVERNLMQAVGYGDLRRLLDRAADGR